jgi:hypothetical protein
LLNNSSTVVYSQGNLWVQIIDGVEHATGFSGLHMEMRDVDCPPAVAFHNKYSKYWTSEPELRSYNWCVNSDVIDDFVPRLLKDSAGHSPIPKFFQTMWIYLGGSKESLHTAFQNAHAKIVVPSQGCMEEIRVSSILFDIETLYGDFFMFTFSGLSMKESFRLLTIICYLLKEKFDYQDFDPMTQFLGLDKFPYMEEQAFALGQRGHIAQEDVESFQTNASIMKMSLKCMAKYEDQLVDEMCDDDPELVGEWADDRITLTSAHAGQDLMGPRFFVDVPKAQLDCVLEPEDSAKERMIKKFIGMIENAHEIKNWLPVLKFRDQLLAKYPDVDADSIIQRMVQAHGAQQNSTVRLTKGEKKRLKQRNKR